MKVNSKIQKKWKNALATLGWPKKFDCDINVNRWGSYQYATALGLYDLIQEMRKEMTLQEAFELLGVDIFFHTIFDMKAVLQRFRTFTNAQYDNSNYSDAERAKICKTLKGIKDVEEMFIFCRENAWDLWAAAPHIIDCILDGFKITSPRSPGKGPIGNVIAQSQNYTVGIICAWLVDKRYVSNDTPFMDFDT